MSYFFKIQKYNNSKSSHNLIYKLTIFNMYITLNKTWLIFLKLFSLTEYRCWMLLCGDQESFKVDT